MFIKDFIEGAIKLNILSQDIRVMSAVQKESTRPESGSADLCFEVIISTLKDNKECYIQILLIVEHKSFYEELAIFSQVKYHNGLYQEQISLSEELLPVISLFCCHGKGTIKTPKSTRQVLLKKGFSQLSLELFKPFILSLKWLLLDFSDEKVLSLFRDKECSYIVHILHQGLDFKLTEESLLEVIRLVSRVKDPYKRSKGMESVLAYVGSLSPDKMTDTLLRSVDFKAKKENLLKEGESIVKYSSMRELIRAEAREEGIEKGIVKGMEQGRQEVILKLLKADMSVEKVSEITGLPKQEIRNFQEESK